MITSTFTNIKIVGIAAAVPSKEITVEELSKQFGTDIVERTVKMVGVRRSRQSVKKQLSSDLGYTAAKRIMDEKHIEPADIGILIYVSQTPDYRVPATAVILQWRLGLSQNCLAFDVNLGCSGFVYGVEIACSILNKTECRNALVIVGDTSSKLGESENRASSILFGDGSAAILLEKDNSADRIDAAFRTDGNRYPAIIIPNGAFRAKCFTNEELIIGNRSFQYPLMSGVDVFNFSIRDVPELIGDFLVYQKKTIMDYDSIVLHQANMFILKQIGKKIGATKEQLLISLDRYGNTSSASIPITLVDKYGSQTTGSVNTLMCGFGVGLSWGLLSASISLDTILPMIVSDDYYIPYKFDQQKYEG